MTAPLRAQPARTTARNGIGYTALGLGILALITSPLLVGLLFGSLAVTLGLAGLDAAAYDEATNRKSALAAAILGVIASVIGIIALVVRIGFLICRFG
jgi:hypothetical protein